MSCPRAIPRIRIVVVDDHPLVRLALKTALPSCDATLEIVGEASSVRESIPIIRDSIPDVVIADMILRGTSGAAAIREIRQAAPSSRVLVYTALLEPGFAVDALGAGADGFAVKTGTVDELLAAIRQVLRGESYLAPSIEKTLGDGKLIRKESRSRLLSAREREVFDLVVAGNSSQQVADLLFISVKTVETHRGRINKKLGATSTADLVRFAALNRLLVVPSARELR
ncbi:MAG: two component transcriptional regulator, LuxR family [Myxococcales bacterium]|nr:two component transcriptional regulator, LuxR family [Myxococcales bacterium]